MRKSYGFSASETNLYVKKLRKIITTRLDEGTIGFFKKLAESTGIPYQSLINLNLEDCAEINRDLKFQWN